VRTDTILSIEIIACSKRSVIHCVKTVNSKSSILYT
jgi:hypothetical protein